MKRAHERSDKVAENAAGQSTSREGLGAFMTVEDVAEMLRINKSTVYRMAKAGRIPATRVGRQWRFRLSALEDFLDAGGDVAFEAEHQDVEEPLRKAVNRW
jgi:excisionase family DNA binding protein